MVEQDQTTVEIGQKAGLVSICRETLYKLQASLAKNVFVLGRSIAIGVPTSRWRFFPILPDFLNWKSATKTKKRLVILGSISSGLHLQSPKQAQSRSFVKTGGIFRETRMAKNAKLGPKTCIYLYSFVFEARFHVPG